MTPRDGRDDVTSDGRERARWVKNLLADPRVSIRLDDRTFSGRARVVELTPD